MARILQDCGHKCIVLVGGATGLIGDPTNKSDMRKLLSHEEVERNAREIKNLVRGLNPIMGAYTFIKDKKVKLWSVQVLENDEFVKEFSCDNGIFDSKNNGEVLLADAKKGLFLKADGGVISVLEIQAENAKRMNVLDFLRGNVNLV